MAYDFFKDYGAFVADLPRLMRDHNGLVVVYHDGERVLGEYESLADALHAGAKAFGAGKFSAQRVAPQIAFRVSQGGLL